MDKNEALLEFAALTKNEFYDPEWHGGEWMIESVETHETIADFVEASAGWKEHGRKENGFIGDFPFVSWRDVQVKKGVQRQDLSVIDLGDVRYVLNMNLAMV